jgi:hypothetical protein
MDAGEWPDHDPCAVEKVRSKLRKRGIYHGSRNFIVDARRTTAHHSVVGHVLSPMMPS